MSYQLPPDVRHFQNRDEERTQVLRAAGWQRPAGGRPLVVSVSGMGGMGKTALGVHLAHQLAAQGEYLVRYVNLDDHQQDGGADIAEALGELLRSFRVRDWLETTFEGRRKQYWEQTGRRRLVVIVDNARFFRTEVEPLLPASADSVLIVISQEKLYDIRGGADLELPVGPLEAGDAEQLLAKIVRDPRLAADPASAAALARICGGLPAALEVAAEWVRGNEMRRLSRLIAELTAELDEKGVPTVEAVWDAAYRRLSPGAATLYRLLAGYPGPYILPEAAVALLGEGEDAAEDALGELVRASLLLRARGGRRLRMHDLLRAHAVRCARRRGVEGVEGVEGRRRVVRWYLRQAQRADLLAAGPRMTFGEVVPALPDAPDMEFTRGAEGEGEGEAAGEDGKGAALRWLEAERLALFACVRTAYAAGLDSEAWALCEPLFTHYLDHPHYTAVTDAFRTGRDAAQRAGHPLALVRMRCQLARSLWEQREYAGAGDEIGQAMAAVGALGDGTRERKLRASAIEFRGMLSSAQGDWASAAADFEASGRIHIEIENDYGAMLQTYRLGQALAELGESELPRAITLLEQAHAQAREDGRARMAARTGFELGRVLHRVGRRDEARALYEAALVGARQRGSGREEVRSLEALADLADETGAPDTARQHRAAADAVRERGGALGSG